MTPYLDTKLQKCYHYTGLSVRRQFHSAYEQKQPKREFPIVDSNALVGIEVEVENIPNSVNLNYYWSATEDGSLRNNGIEFISIPLRGSQIEYAVRYLFTQLQENNDPVFSPRTSIHIHLNVRDFSWNQVKTLVILYALFEKHFFHTVGTTRETNIFCVPLYKSQQLASLDSIEQEVKWYKYNALNIAPIYGDGDVKQHGTIEFRHLYGTDDLPTIMNWINTILKLRQACSVYSLEDILEKIKTLNTTSEYIGLYTSIFGEYANLRNMTKYDFESCVSDVKAALWGRMLHEQQDLKNSRYSIWSKEQYKQKETKDVKLIEEFKILSTNKLNQGFIVNPTATDTLF